VVQAAPVKIAGKQPSQHKPGMMPGFFMAKSNILQDSAKDDVAESQLTSLFILSFSLSLSPN
jgi:predicted DNA-binding protein (MmcQ/YjbR family)